MYPDVPLLAGIALLAGGLAALAWSSDFFVAGASSLARAMGVSPFIIGMVVIGFGTSAPELCVSVLSGIGGKSNLSLGNAYGSCIFNIAAIMGVVALIRPIRTRPAATVIASLVLAAAAGVSAVMLQDGEILQTEALVLLGIFAVVFPLYCWREQRKESRRGGRREKKEIRDERQGGVSAARSAAKLVIGLGVLIGSAHILVWGAVDVAKALGVSDLLIGLTVVAIGTSLPELASAIASARRGENEFVIGNIVGSNLFNTLCVVGVACAISPARGFSGFIATRDVLLVLALSLSIAVFGLDWRSLGRQSFGRRGHITRLCGFIWIAVYAVYAYSMIRQEVGAANAARDDPRTEEVVSGACQES